MAAPVVVGTPTTAEPTGNVNSVTLNQPAGLANGDLLVVAVFFQNSTGDLITAPSGWTRIGADPAAELRPSGFYVRPVPTAAGTPSTFTFSTSAAVGRAAGICFRVSGADLSSYLDVVSNKSSGTGTTSCVLPTMTTSGPDRLVLGYCYTNTGAGTGAPTVTSANLTLVDSVTIAPSANSVLWVGRSTPGAGATGTRTMSFSPAVANSGGYMFAIAPLPAVTASPSSIASAEAFGSPTATVGPPPGPAGIAFGAAGARLLVPANSSSWAVPYPAGITAGQVLVMHIVTNGGTITTPAGWTAAYNETTLTNPKGGLYYKVATGSESGTLAVTAGNTTGNAMMFSYTGVDTTNPLDAAATSYSNAATVTSTDLPSINVVTDGAWLIYANGLNSGSTVVESATGTQRIDHSEVGGTGTKSGGLFDESGIAAGSTGTRSITHPTRTAWGAMMALRPLIDSSGTPSDVAPASIASGEAFGVTMDGVGTASLTTFDDGTATGWTQSTAGAGTLSVTSAAAHDGPFGASSNVPAALVDKAGYTRSISPAYQATIRGWWKVTTEGGSGSNVPFARFFNGSQRLADVYRQNVAGGPNVWLRVAKAIGGSNYYFIPTGYRLEVDEWVYVSFTWGLDGNPYLFINGEMVVGPADRPADWFAATKIDTVWLGSQEPGNAGAWAIDSVDLQTHPTPQPGELRNLPVLTGEAFGSPAATLGPAPTTASPAGIASAQAFGSPTISTSLSVAPTGIGSAQAFGTPVVTTGAEATEVRPTGIASAETFGTLAIVTDTSAYPVGIASTSALGTPSVSTTLTAAPAGIASAGAFGAPAVSTTLTAAPGSITTSEAFGTPTASVGSPATVLSPADIPSGEAFGSPAVIYIRLVITAGIPSLESFGTPAISKLLVTFPANIPGIGNVFGSPTLSTRLDVAASGIPTGEAFGHPEFIKQPLLVGPAGIPSLEAVGTPTAGGSLAVRVEIELGARIGPSRYGGGLGKQGTTSKKPNRWEGTLG